MKVNQQLLWDPGNINTQSMDVILRLGKFGEFLRGNVGDIFHSIVELSRTCSTSPLHQKSGHNSVKENVQAFHGIKSVGSIVSYTIKCHFRLIRSIRVALSVLWFPGLSLQ